MFSARRSVPRIWYIGIDLNSTISSRSDSAPQYGWGSSGAESAVQRAGRGSGSLTPEVKSRGACRLSHSALGQARAMPASATGPARRRSFEWAAGLGSGTG